MQVINAGYWGGGVQVDGRGYWLGEEHGEAERGGGVGGLTLNAWAAFTD